MRASMSLIAGQHTSLESKIFVPLWKRYFAFSRRNPFTTVGTLSNSCFDYLLTLGLVDQMLLTTFAVIGFLPVLSFW